MKHNSKKFMSKKLGAVMAAALLTTTFSSIVPVSAAETTILNSTFETGNDGWTNWGNCYTMPANWTKHNGNNSLFVGNRQANWNGPLFNLTGKVKPGHTYNISSYWMSWNINNNENVKLTVSYKNNNGQINYIVVGKNTTNAGNWTSLGGQFTVPNNATDVAVYFETERSTADLYIDDVKITEVSAGNDIYNPQPNPNPNPNPNPQPDTNPGSSINGVTIYEDCPANNLTKRPNVQYSNFEHKTYYSSTTRSNRGFNIMLPANYNPQKKYPVLYILHGIFGNEFSLVGNHISEIVANQIADGKAKEMIVVLPNMYAATNGSAPSFTDEGVAGYDNFVNDLTNDLMPYIEKNYSVSTAREDQAIAGFSMGGREALYIGITRSDIFGYVMGIAPAPGLTPGRDAQMYHKGQLQENQLRPKAGYDPYALMICCGTADGVVTSFPESYHKTLDRNGVKNLWYTINGAGHDDRAIASGINNFVAAIFHAK